MNAMYGNLQCFVQPRTLLVALECVSDICSLWPIMASSHMWIQKGYEKHKYWSLKIWSNLWRATTGMRRKGYNFIYLSPFLHRKINHNEKGGEIEMVTYSFFSLSSRGEASSVRISRKRLQKLFAGQIRRWGPLNPSRTGRDGDSDTSPADGGTGGQCNERRSSRGLVV